MPINEAGCVLTWDFDVARGECEFVLLRSNKIMFPEQVRENNIRLNMI